MSFMKKHLQKLILGILTTLLSWTLIKYLVIELSIIQYFFVELIIVISLKLYIFTVQKNFSV